MRLADLDYEMTGSVVIARLKGEIDMSNAAELREELAKLTPNEALGLVLDLTGIGYLDSAGIHLMYRLEESLKSRGQGFRIVVPLASLVNDTLRLAGINRGEQIVETVAEAQEALTRGHGASQPTETGS